MFVFFVFTYVEWFVKQGIVGGGASAGSIGEARLGHLHGIPSQYYVIRHSVACCTTLVQHYYMYKLLWIIEYMETKKERSICVCIFINRKESN